MMAQKLMSDNKDNPFNSRFFQPSDAYSKQQTRPIQGDLTLGNIASYFMPFSKDIGPYEDSPKLDRPGGVNIDFPPIVKDAVSGINKFGQVFRGELSQDEIKQLAFDTSLNVTGGSLVGSKLLKNAVPKDALSMGLLSNGSKATETSKLFKSVNKFPALSKSEETLVASSSAPVNEIAGLGRVKIEKIDPNDMAGSKKRFDELKALTSGYKQDRAKAKIIRLENGENAIQYMQPPTEVKKLNISELIATQDNVVLGTNKTAGDVMPLVVKKDGKFFIRDGHHRIAQNINSGDKTADVRVIDLDKGGFLGVKATNTLDDIKNKYPNVDLSVFSKPEGITLSKIVVPKDARSEGIGSKVMKDLIKYADENNLPIALTPDSSFGGSKTRLKSFYRNFGFKDNKGRNKDFSFRESMIRQPKSK